MPINPEPFEMWKLLYASLMFISMCLIISAFVMNSYGVGIRSWGSGWMLLTAIGMAAGIIPALTMTVVCLHGSLFLTGHIAAGIVTSIFSLTSYAIFYDSFFGGKLFFGNRGGVSF